MWFPTIIRSRAVNQVIVITGASSGFRTLTARAFADAGYNLYAGMHKTTSGNADAVTQLSEYAASRRVELNSVEMDVSSEESVDAAITSIVEELTNVAKRLADLAPADADAEDVAAAIVSAVDSPAGKRPYRVHIDPADDGSAVVSAMADRIRVDFLNRIGLADLMAPSSPAVV
jgi:hypothetical protein